VYEQVYPNGAIVFDLLAINGDTSTEYVLDSNGRLEAVYTTSPGGNVCSGATGFAYPSDPNGSPPKVELCLDGGGVGG
jgi:hypothetical protein